MTLCIHAALASCDSSSPMAKLLIPVGVNRIISRGQVREESEQVWNTNTDIYSLTCANECGYMLVVDINSIKNASVQASNMALSRCSGVKGHIV